MLEENYKMRQLIDRCLPPESDRDGWIDLVGCCQQELLLCARRTLRAYSMPSRLAEEFVQNLWETVWERGCALLRNYNPQRGPLPRYLAKQLRHEIADEKRRRARDAVLKANCQAHPHWRAEDDSSFSLTVVDYLHTLDPAVLLVVRARHLCEPKLECPYQASYIEKLSSAAVRSVHHFFRDN